MDDETIRQALNTAPERIALSEEEEQVGKILREINADLENDGFKLSDTHFEIGDLLHCETYYFAKKYFQSTHLCANIVPLFVSRVRSLSFEGGGTLIGFGNYTGLCLKMTTDRLNEGLSDGEVFNYGTLEKQEDSFTWQFVPDLKRNLIVVLPITCTSSVYIRILKFLKHFTATEFPGVQFDVSADLINVFLVLDSSLEHRMDRVQIYDKLGFGDAHLNEVYSQFNWTEITNDHIVIKPRYKAWPLVTLYSKIHLADKCTQCFPPDEAATSERPIIPTTDNRQTPNLIFRFPNFSFSEDTEPRFFKLMRGYEKGGEPVHLSGHIEVDNESYDNYIRGNYFYEHNREDILDFFDDKLRGHLGPKDKHIIFITSDNRHKSTFIEDLTVRESLKDRMVTIFRFQPFHEFVDNFISLYGSFIGQKGTRIIYFQEVLSSGRKFKLISDYIKHARDTGFEFGIRGFDLLITFINRLSAYTENELVRKLSSREHQQADGLLLAYLNLDAPLFSTPHLANPLRDEIERLRGMIRASYLDTLRLRLQDRLERAMPQRLHALKQKGDVVGTPPYYHFFSNNILLNDRVFEAYGLDFTKAKAEFLKLYMIHRLNNELAKPIYSDKDFLAGYRGREAKFVTDLFEMIFDSIRNDLHFFFSSEVRYDMFEQKRDREAERIYLEGIFVKILSRPPFAYYKTIYEGCFKFCLNRVQAINKRMADGNRNPYSYFRTLKFYIRRSIELDSNFIISHDFWINLKNHLAPATIARILDSFSRKRGELADAFQLETIEEPSYAAQISALAYQEHEVKEYVFFLLMCLKEFLCKNPSRSIPLEELLNSEDLRPQTGESIAGTIQSPYYQFVTMVRIENSLALNGLKELHKKSFGGRKSLRGGSYVNYYFRPGAKNDPIIIAARLLLERSLFRLQGDEAGYQETLRSLEAMLKLVDELGRLEKNRRRKPGSFDVQIRKIIGYLLDILQEGTDRQVEYAFCIEYRKRQPGVPGAENIYTILSDEGEDRLKLPQIREEGLIYHLLSGLYGSRELKSEQTFVASVHNPEDDRYYSFQQQFWGRTESGGGTHVSKNPLDFDTLYKSDLHNEHTEKGIGFLKRSNMALFVRFATFRKQADESQEQLEGQAVLVVGNLGKHDYAAFRNFMNPEKLRLLLLMKEEIISYLQRQFESDAFIEILEHRKRDIYQRKLEHGLSRYQQIQKNLFDDSLKTRDIAVQRKNRELYDLIDQITNAQLNFQKLPVQTQPILFPSEMLTGRILDIFASGSFCGDSIGRKEVSLTGFTEMPVAMPASIFDIVIPEIIINMKSYSSRLVRNGLKIEFKVLENTLIFINDIKARYLDNDIEKPFGGLRMCRMIVDNLRLHALRANREGSEFHVILNLNPLEDAKDQKKDRNY